ncbi:MAG: phosphoserine phosphatase SerB [Polyangiaceae bacterium]
MAQNDRIILHVAGPDRPGVTAKLAEVIASEHARLVNIGQSVLHGYLNLSAVIDLPTTSGALREILFSVSALGLKVDVAPFTAEMEETPFPPRSALCVSFLGALGDGSSLAEITRYIAGKNLNIRQIRPLSDDGFSGVELIADSEEKELTDTDVMELRGDLLAMGARLHVDMAVQRDDIFRRNKRLVCMDVDSTFVNGEFIDELAELCGVKDRVAEITKRAMAGELDFSGALRERVKLLEGLPMERARSLSDRFELNPGAETFVKILKSLGFRVGLVSGGFDFFVDELRQRFSLDFAFANELEVKDGLLTGNVLGTIVDPQRKAQLLKDMAKTYEVRLEQTVAIGDGANDIFMLQTAGLGIAYRAKPKLQAVADMSLNHNEGRLDALLHLMGFTAQELAGIAGC